MNTTANLHTALPSIRAALGTDQSPRSRTAPRAAVYRATFRCTAILDAIQPSHPTTL